MLRRWVRGPGGWIAAIAAAAVLFVALNAGLRPVSGVRLDLTEQKLYTVSDGTERILADIEDPVEITFYLSADLTQRLPAFGPYVQRVRDLLNEMANRAGGKLRLETVDPEPFSPQEDAAVDAGLKGTQATANGDKLYFGLVARTAPEDPEAESYNITLPFFQLERRHLLEYDIAKLIHRLGNPERPTVGVVSGSEVFGNFQERLSGGDPEPWAIIPHASDFFQVERVWDVKHFRQHDFDVLAIIHPANLNDEMLYEIDQFLLRGGKALMFIDPWHETAVQGSRMDGMLAVDTASEFDRILGHWGVTIPQGEVVADRTIGRRINAGTEDDPLTLPYIAWLEPGPINLNPAHPLTQDVNGMLIPTPGSIALAGDSPLTMEPLIRTSAEAMRLSTKQLAPPDPVALMEAYEPGGERLPIAARLTGRVASLFPDGAPSRREGRPPHVAESQVPLDVILMADADMLVDRYWVRRRQAQGGGGGGGDQVFVPWTDNGAFLVNALDYLAGSDALISLRSRGTGQRPFTVINDLRRAAEERYRARERRLREEMTALEEKLGRVRAGEAGPEILEGRSPAAAVEAFTDRLIETRRSLRAVTHDLRKDIERLRARVEFANIGLIPLLLTLFALTLWAIRLRLRRRALRR